MFPSTVTIAHKQSIDAHHVVSYGTAQTVSCRYQEMQERVLDSNGAEVLSTAWLQFPAGTSIDYDSKITLPSNETPKIVSINRIKNHLGIEVCVEVYLATSGGSL
jgi:hypothetical protein